MMNYSISTDNMNNDQIGALDFMFSDANDQSDYALNRILSQIEEY